MRNNHFFSFLFINIFLISATVSAQTINFDETWKEFLENNKISNMSELYKPDKQYKKADYAKYLLMNINSDFCQSKIGEAESALAEIKDLGPRVYQPIKGFTPKMNDLEAKIKAYYSMDKVWGRFLKTKKVTPTELDAIKGVKTVCEKQTLAKYSYMTAHHYLCEGEIEKAKNIFERRTLRLAEKTSLKVENIEGMAIEVANMKTLFQGLAKLNAAWDKYVETGTSPGFKQELPLFPCYATPKIKELLLRGSANLCNQGLNMLNEVKRIQEEYETDYDPDIEDKIEDLTDDIADQDANLAKLNEAWKAFIPENKVKIIDYSHEYCSSEPLIRAYIMDGFTYVCELAEESLQQIKVIRKKERRLKLDDTTLSKIKELEDLMERYELNGIDIEETWKTFVAQGDTLVGDFISSETYCDNIQKVKDWVIAGTTGTCEDKNLYLQKIENFQETFEFSFTEELECHVQYLRIRLWDCRYEALAELASLDISDVPRSEKIAALLEEYEMGERPENCLK